MVEGLEGYSYEGRLRMPQEEVSFGRGEVQVCKQGL